MADAGSDDVKINPDLTPLLRPIDSLREDPANARRHPERNMAAIAASLSRHGQQKPIVVDRSGTVIAGNGTLRAALSLGWTQIAAVEFDGDDEMLAKAYAIEDNRTAELAEWDLKVLSEGLKELVDAKLIDPATWADYELEPLLRAEWTPPPPSEMPRRDEVHSIRFTEEQWVEVQRVISIVEKRDGQRTMADVVVDAMRKYSL